MINRIKGNDQVAYHQNAFNRLLLPNLDAAGPISASLLGELANPMKFLLNQRKGETTDMAWGSMVDMMWLTPADWGKHFAMLPPTYPKKPSVTQRNAKKPSQGTIDAISWWDAFERKTLGKTVIDENKLGEVKAAVEMLNRHPLAKLIFDNSEKQVILAGTSDQLHPSGKSLKAKAMMDLLPMVGSLTVEGTEIPLDECIVDLKQCHDTSEYGMKRAIRDFQYHVKTEWYNTMLRATGDTKRKHSILIFQNSKAPNDVHIRKISQEDMDWAKLEIVRRIDLLSQLNPLDNSNLFDVEVQNIYTSFK